MRLNRLHSWDVSPADAVRLQRDLARDLVYDRPIDLARVRLVAGVDVSVKENVSHAAVVIMTFPELEVVETQHARMPTPFPYVPGLLSFREGPVLEEAFAKIEREPDVFVFDGMGRAHPRRIGIACHMGLWLERPTIGCGKTLLTGRYVEPPDERGASADLMDKGEIVGKILRTRVGVKPVFVSVGHLAELASATELVMRCTSKYRLPIPIRRAHDAAGAFDPGAQEGGRGNR
jgi:deoxyribonuclease V